MEITGAMVASAAAELCGLEVSEAAGELWLDRVLSRVSGSAGDDALCEAVLMAASRYAAADRVDCDPQFAARMSAAGLSVEGRSGSEAARALRRSAAQAIAPYIEGCGGVVRAWIT